jgi:hypothetical protein
LVAKHILRMIRTIFEWDTEKKQTYNAHTRFKGKVIYDVFSHLL